MSASIKTLMSTAPSTAAAINSTPVSTVSKYYPVAVKTVAAGGSFYVINMLMATNSTAKSQITAAAVVGASVGVGSLLKEVFAPIRQSYLPFLNGKTSSFEGRILESSSAVLGTYLLDRVIMKNTFALNPTKSLSTQNVIAIIVSDLLAEALSDIFFARNINLLDE
jgi:hypothetical protein